MGIPSEFIHDLGKKEITFKGNKGRGLGLVHANNRIQEWGGNLGLKSELGAGTEVCIKLVKLENVENQLGS